MVGLVSPIISDVVLLCRGVGRSVVPNLQLTYDLFEIDVMKEQPCLAMLELKARSRSDQHSKVMYLTKVRECEYFSTEMLNLKLAYCYLLCSSSRGG